MAEPEAQMFVGVGGVGARGRPGRIGTRTNRTNRRYIGPGCRGEAERVVGYCKTVRVHSMSLPAAGRPAGLARGR